MPARKSRWQPEHATCQEAQDMRAENERLRGVLTLIDILLRDHFCVVRYDRPADRDPAVEAALEAVSTGLTK